MKNELIEQLNAETKDGRLGALRGLYDLHRQSAVRPAGNAGGEPGALEMPRTGISVNNHIHTTFSFSPYSPAKAVYMAWTSGLATAGIMDHDSVSGAREFIEAGKIVGLPVTVGFECRCSMKGTMFEGRRINNPDQDSVAYVAMHGVPHGMLGEAERFLAPYRAERNERNRKMTARLNERLLPYGLEIDFERDVLPLSQHSLGGSVTERHLLYALCAKLSEDEMARQFLLGVFKSHLVESIYIDADEELPHLTEFISLAERLGAIAAYPYLGDVGVSVTGDKRAQCFEDSFLDELLVYLKHIGFRGVTYMPARNSPAQLSRIIGLCAANGLFQISGEDINSPLQNFICEKLETPECRHLIDSAWALIGHELACADGLSNGMFSPDTIARMPDLNERVRYFADLAREGGK